jgi:hypothetical protein
MFICKISGTIFQKERRHPKHYLVVVKKVPARSDVPCLRNGDDSALFCSKIDFEKNAKKVDFFLSAFRSFSQIFLFIKNRIFVLKMCLVDRRHLNVYTNHKNETTENFGSVPFTHISNCM